MTDRPVIGQIGRVSGTEQLKIEVIGELTPNQWDDFKAALMALAKRFPNLTIKEQKYKVKVKSVPPEQQKK
jgi:autonomous glycyl radical cofactor GrcA